MNAATRGVLVDEDLPPRLALDLAAELGEATRCSSVRDEGWRGLKNGALLARMVERGFAILVTADRNMVHQQPLARFSLAAVVIIRPLHRAAMFARVTAIADAVRAVQPGTSIEIPLTEKRRLPAWLAGSGGPPHSIERSGRFPRRCTPAAAARRQPNKSGGLNEPGRRP